MALGILCPGQGAQHPRMLAPLAGDAAAEAVLASAAAVLGRAPAEMLRERPDDIFRNALAQPLLCAVELATWAALRTRLPTPRACAGYSVGELAAYACAGALDADELLRLAVRRAELMDLACAEPSGLVAVRGLTQRPLAALCAAHGVTIAIVNDVDRCVVGGRRAELDAFTVAARAAGAALTPLSVSVASHTPLLQPAAEAFAATLAASGLRAPLLPVLAGLDGAPVYDRARAVDTLARQIAHTVDWAACLDGLVEAGCRVLLELGPGSGLARMARERHPELAVRAVDEFRSLDGVVAWVERQL